MYVAAVPQHDGFDDDSDAEAGTSAPRSFDRRSPGHSRHTPRTYDFAAAAAAGHLDGSEQQQPGEAVGTSVEAGESSVDVHVSARRPRGRRVLTSQTQPSVYDV